MNHLVIVAIIATLAETGAALQAHGVAPGDGSEQQPALVAYDATIQSSLDRIWRASPSWRLAWQDVAPTGRRALVLTPDQVIVREASANSGGKPFDRRVLAEVSPVADDAGRVGVVLVVINLPLLQAVHAERGSLPVEFQDDLDRVIAHEVYGHALPYLQTGNLSGRCADPVPGQRAIDACAIRRENVVRQELGLNRRTDAGLNGLALAFRGRY